SPSPMGGSILRLERRALHPALRFKPLPIITERENDTLRWMIEGKRNSEIGLILGISERTVEKHVSAIMSALSAENRATAIVRAMERMAG
ncbi:MAG: response regulator transcription factor, partial [Roseimicrobium sp.]